MEHRYLDEIADDLDDAIARCTAAKRERRALSVGLAGNCARVLPELLRRGVEVDIVTDQTSAHDPLSYLPEDIDPDDWDDYAAKKPAEFTERSRASMARHVAAMVGFQDAGAEVFELFPDNGHLRRWIRAAQERVAFQGLPARICWLGYGERGKAGCGSTTWWRAANSPRRS